MSQHFVRATLRASRTVLPPRCHTVNYDVWCHAVLYGVTTTVPPLRYWTVLRGATTTVPPTRCCAVLHGATHGATRPVPHGASWCYPHGVTHTVRCGAPWCHPYGATRPVLYGVTRPVLPVRFRTIPRGTLRCSGTVLYRAAPYGTVVHRGECPCGPRVVFDHECRPP